MHINQKNLIGAANKGADIKNRGNMSLSQGGGLQMLPMTGAPTGGKTALDTNSGAAMNNIIPNTVQHASIKAYQQAPVKIMGQTITSGQEFVKK